LNANEIDESERRWPLVRLRVGRRISLMVNSGTANSEGHSAGSGSAADYAFGVSASCPASRPDGGLELLMAITTYPNCPTCAPAGVMS